MLSRIHKFYILVLLYSHPLLAQTPAPELIPNPTTGHFYTTVEGGNFAESRLFATLGGGYVVAINDAAETDFLAAQIPTNFFVIGLTAEASPPAFLWESGEPLNYTNWRNLQPLSPNTRPYAYSLSGEWRTDSTGEGLAVIEFEAPPSEGPANLVGVFDSTEGLVTLTWQTGTGR